MDMFGDDVVEEVPVLEVFKAHIERGDAKGAIDLLRGLDKQTCGETLLRSGFQLTGSYREWVKCAAFGIQDAAMKRCLPRSAV